MSCIANETVRQDGRPIKETLHGTRVFIKNSKKIFIRIEHNNNLVKFTVRNLTAK